MSKKPNDPHLLSIPFIIACPHCAPVSRDDTKLQATLQFPTTVWVHFDEGQIIMQCVKCLHRIVLTPHNVPEPPLDFKQTMMQQQTALKA